MQQWHKCSNSFLSKADVYGINFCTFKNQLGTVIKRVAVDGRNVIRNCHCCEKCEKKTRTNKQKAAIEKYMYKNKIKERYSQKCIKFEF